jgi:hypothetical protein
MSIIGLQMRARRLGSIRLGDTVTKNGKTYPVSLETFRLTSISKGLLDQAAVLWGGTVRPWQPKPNSASQFQLITETNELPVLISPQDPESMTFYELWSAGGLQRRCDGETMTHQGQEKPCACDPDDRECKMTTRLSVMLPDLPDVGVWTLTSTGYYAATEMAASIQVVMTAAQKTGFLPEATLAIEQRELKQPGNPTKKFSVPVVRFSDTLSLFLERSSPAPSLPAGADGGEGERTVQSHPEPSPTNAMLNLDRKRRELQAQADEEAVFAPIDNFETVEQLQEQAREMMDDPGASWSDLLVLLEEDASEGTMGTVEVKLRKLFRLMHQAELWPDAYKSLHATLKKHNAVEHVGDLRKNELNEFTELTFAAARKKVEEAE